MDRILPEKEIFLWGLKIIKVIVGKKSTETRGDEQKTWLYSALRGSVDRGSMELFRSNFPILRYLGIQCDTDWHQLLVLFQPLLNKYIDTYLIMVTIYTENLLLQLLSCFFSIWLGIVWYFLLFCYRYWYSICRIIYRSYLTTIMAHLIRCAAGIKLGDLASRVRLLHGSVYKDFIITTEPQGAERSGILCCWCPAHTNESFFFHVSDAKR